MERLGGTRLVGVVAVIQSAVVRTTKSVRYIDIKQSVDAATQVRIAARRV